MAGKTTISWTSVPVDELNITKQSLDLLKDAGVATVGQLSGMSDLDLSHVPGMRLENIQNCRWAVRYFLTQWPSDERA
jgi:DNA-directed RNA polymerase alpha subunit